MRLRDERENEDDNTEPQIAPGGEVSVCLGVYFLQQPLPSCECDFKLFDWSPFTVHCLRPTVHIIDQPSE